MTNVFAILDASNHPQVPGKVLELDGRAQSLWQGQTAIDFAAVAPYLAECDDDLQAWILNEFPGQHWGILVRADCNLMSLRKHLRRFLQVQLPDSRMVYFRFYDPRVLLPFVRSCTASERQGFFGPASEFGVLSRNQWTWITREV